MIRNILYSLFLHSAIILIVYLSFNLQRKAEPPKESKVVMSFVIKSDNAALSESFLKKSQMVPPKEPVKEPIPEKKPEKIPEKKVEKKVEKKTPPKPKEKKLDPKKIKPKPEKPKLEKPKPEKPKPEKPKPVEPKKEEEKKEEPEIKEEIKEIEAPKEEIDPDQPLFTENTIEGMNLLVREKFNIQSQIARCYKKSLDESGMKSKVIINAHIFVGEKGDIDVNEVIIKDFYKYEDPKEAEFHKAVDVVKQALTFCSPIRNLPEDKYDVWKEIDLQFDGE